MASPTITQIVAVRSAIMTLLEAKTGSGEDLEGVLIARAWRDTPRSEVVWLGDVSEGDENPATLKSGRRTREDEVDHDVNIQVIRSSAAAAETEAARIAGVLEGICADDPKLGLSIISAVPSRWRLKTSPHDELRYRCEIVVTITATTYKR